MSHACSAELAAQRNQGVLVGNGDEDEVRRLAADEILASCNGGVTCLNSLMTNWDVSADNNVNVINLQHGLISFQDKLSRKEIKKSIILCHHR